MATSTISTSSSTQMTVYSQQVDESAVTRFVRSVSRRKFASPRSTSLSRWSSSFCVGERKGEVGGWR